MIYVREPRINFIVSRSLVATIPSCTFGRFPIALITFYILGLSVHLSRLRVRALLPSFGILSWDKDSAGTAPYNSFGTRQTKIFSASLDFLTKLYGPRRSFDCYTRTSEFSWLLSPLSWSFGKLYFMTSSGLSGEYILPYFECYDFPSEVN